MTICTVKHCNSNRIHTRSPSLFEFPADPIRRKHWIQNCKATHLLNKNHEELRRKYRVCGDHFEDTMFRNPLSRNRLMPFAVPTVFGREILMRRELSASRSANVQLSSSIPVHNGVVPVNPSFFIEQVATNEASNQTPSFLSHDTPRKRKLLNEVQRLKCQNKELKKNVNILTQQVTQMRTVDYMLQLCKHYLPPCLTIIIEAHVNRIKNMPMNCRYSREFKQLALQVFLLGSNVYNFFRTTFAFPNRIRFVCVDD